MAEQARRVRIFVDFWNFQINWNVYQGKIGATVTSPVPIPWKRKTGIGRERLPRESAAGFHHIRSGNSLALE